MFPAQISTTNLKESSRCEESSQMLDHAKSPSKIQKADAAIKDSIDRALWKDDVLRAIEYSEIAVHVKNGVLYLHGHIVGTTSWSRIENAMRAIPGILGIKNNLVLDERLTNEVATSLGTLEHTYACKFFTGASHGVISLNGIVNAEDVKSLAEQCAAANPNVRGVINNVSVSGSQSQLADQPFLQPIIGEIIYFLDGISGIVKQVIINPNNRRVVAMTVRGQFAGQRQALQSLESSEARSPERLVVLSMDLVRYLTKVSGFLYINSNEREKFTDFDPALYHAPDVDWTPPYPYCPEDVLFPVEKREVQDQISEKPSWSPLTITLSEQQLWEQLLADGNLGG